MAIAAPTVTASWDADLERVKSPSSRRTLCLLVDATYGPRISAVPHDLDALARKQRADRSQVDALSYWEKREQAVLDEARRAVETVKATGKPMRMEPMDSSMRRLVHRTLTSNPDVTTMSEGEALVAQARHPSES